MKTAQTVLFCFFKFLQIQSFDEPNLCLPIGFSTLPAGPWIQTSLSSDHFRNHLQIPVEYHLTATLLAQGAFSEVCTIVTSGVESQPLHVEHGSTRPRAR